jgi:CubicO group peptidase (beta-lactamase class C family)
MKNKLGVLFIGVVVLAFASCKSPAMLAREKSIDDIVAKYASNNQPGASVLVFKDDKIVFQKGYGVRTIPVSYTHLRAHET